MLVGPPSKALQSPTCDNPTLVFCPRATNWELDIVTPNSVLLKDVLMFVRVPERAQNADGAKGRPEPSTFGMKSSVVGAFLVRIMILST